MWAVAPKEKKKASLTTHFHLVPSLKICEHISPPQHFKHRDNFTLDNVKLSL
jgi:hypothetical protein